MKFHLARFAAILMMSAVPVSWAAESGHAGHASVPAPIASPPASGKARESGFDGNDMMESTTAENAIDAQCAHAARGLVMLDRATLARCAGVAAPVATPAAAGHHQH